MSGGGDEVGPARRGGATARAARFVVVVVAVCAAVWSWQEAGLSGAGQLWANRERAVDFLLGKKVDESTLVERRLQAEREVRTAIQADARAELERAYVTRGEAPPGLMALMRESAAAADERIAAMEPGAFTALVDARLGEGATGGRRGGFFPPETSARAIFGDPDELGRLHPVARWAIGVAEAAGAGAGRAVRWVVSAVAGDGYTGKLMETIAIALWGTVLAVVVALPASVLGSARGLEIVAPGGSLAARGLRWLGVFVVRRSFDAARGFNEVVLALIFVAMLGLGPLPGVLALVIHTYGLLGKVFAEAITATDRGPIEGVQATGASPTQVVAYAVLPQIMPYVVSQSLLRFESNVRGATILGVVGAGGIGQLLMDKFGAYEFQEVATMMLIIIVVVTLIDLACGRAMKRLV